MAPKLSRLPMKLAIVNPILTNPNVIRIMIGSAYKKVKGSIGIPKAMPTTKTIMP